VEPMSPVKSKKSEIKQWTRETLKLLKQRIENSLELFESWMKKNLSFISFLIILSIGGIPLTLVIFIYGLVAVVAKETMLPSLIEAEATILGFFGLIVVYALTSLDSRMDRYEKQIFDLGEKHWELDLLSRPETEWQILGEEKITFFNKRLSKIKEKKRKTANLALVVGVYLIVSIMSSLLGLGIPDERWSFFLSSLSVALLFVSISGILWIIYGFGKSPEAKSE